MFTDFWTYAIGGGQRCGKVSMVGLSRRSAAGPHVSLDILYEYSVRNICGCQYIHIHSFLYDLVIKDARNHSV